MQLFLTLLASYVAYTNAAPVYVTQTVVVYTQYVTNRVSGSPFALATELLSTQQPSAVFTSAPEEATETAQTTEIKSSVPAPVTTTAAPTTAAAPTTSSSSTSTASTSTLNSFESEILDAHNAKRALHGANPLVWDPVLAQYAADYAATSFSCDRVRLIHSGGPYGENLAAGYVGGEEPVDAWYDEINEYDYSNPGYSEATGHFTQLIWASTTAVGCAEVKCDNAWRQYTICEYYPPGNVLSTDPANRNIYFKENVYPPLA